MTTLNKLSANNLLFAVISDIHLGHKNTKTEKIIANLRKVVLGDPSNKDLDILFLAGDVFDNLMGLNDEDLHEIDYFIDALLRFCLKNDIALRILEGTPSHDWTQSLRFMTIAGITDLKGLDIQYIDNVHVEVNDKFGISILYVPDEIQPTTDKTLKLVIDTIQSKGLEKVDIAIMHGQFEFQLPAHIKHIPRHSSESYLALVRKVIAIGHIHTFSTYDRIVAQGSFDRLTHGQEEPKGYIKVKLTEDGFDLNFIENPDSQIYNTYDVTDFTLEEAFEFLEKTIRNLPALSSVRLKAFSVHPIFHNMNELVLRFPAITFTRLIKDKVTGNTSEEMEDLSLDNREYNPIALTKENLPSLLRDKLMIRFESDEKSLMKCTHLLKECL